MPSPVSPRLRRRQRVADLTFALVSLGGAWLLRVGLADPSGGALGVPASAAWLGVARVGIGLLLAHALLLGWRVWRGGEVAFWSRLRALVIALVLGWLVFLFSGEPFHPPRVAMGMGTALCAFAVLCMLASPARRLGLRRPVRVLDIGLTMLCVVALGLELGLRALSSLLDNPVLMRADAGVAELIGRFRFPPGTPRFGFPCNSLGHYDEEFTPKREGVPLVVCIGDSFSAGIVPHYFHYTTALERLVPTLRVYNMGLPSLGPAEYLHLLRTEAMPLRPDLVMIGVFVGNDIGQDSNPKSPWLASWFNRENVLVSVVPTRLARMWQERRRLGRTELGIVGEQDAGRAELDVMLQRYPYLLDPALEPETHSAVEFLRIEASRAGDVFQPKHAARYPRFFELVDAIVAAAGSTPVMFVMIPDAMQVDDELWRQVGVALPKGEFERDLPQRLLRAHFDAKSYPYVDLLPDFRNVGAGPDGQRHLYQRGDTHINVRGNLRAAAALAGPVAQHMKLLVAPPAEGRAAELVLSPAGAAVSDGSVAVWLPGHTSVRVAVRPGETGADVAEALRRGLGDWGVPCATPAPGVLRIEGVAHVPALGGLAIDLDVVGFEAALSLPLGARWAAAPEVLLAPARADAAAPSQVVIQMLDAQGGVLREGTAVVPAADDDAATRRVLGVDWSRAEGVPASAPATQGAARLRVRLLGPAEVFVDVPSAPGRSAGVAGSAPEGRDVPHLAVRAADSAAGARELTLRCTHVGAPVLLLVSATRTWVPLDFLRPGAALAMVPWESLQVHARTDGEGQLVVPLPPVASTVHVQALVLPPGAGLEALEATRHLELGPSR